MQETVLNPPQLVSSLIGPSTYAAAIVGGSIAAIAGGVLWGLLVIYTEHEYGMAALGLGLLTGAAVAVFSRGVKGVPLQVIAVCASLLGILIGKYFTFFHFLKQAIDSESPVNAAANINLFSMGLIQMFVKNISAMISGYDILWVLLAVVTAWSIPKRDLPFKLPSGK